MHPRREYSSQSRRLCRRCTRNVSIKYFTISGTSSLGGVGAMASFGNFSSSFSIAAAPAAPTQSSKKRSTCGSPTTGACMLVKVLWWRKEYR
jgi:hypothetical protein